MTELSNWRPLAGMTGRAAVAALVVAILACDGNPAAPEKAETAELGVSADLAAFSQVQRDNTLRTRLRTAVEEGWISGGQARRVAEHLESVVTRIRAALAAGDFTREEARETFVRQELSVIGRVLRANVADGILTAEEGRAAMAAYSKLLGIDGVTTTR
jgi:hypothetical protein